MLFFQRLAVSNVATTRFTLKNAVSYRNNSAAIGFLFFEAA
jgi:hypothetical protein